MSRLAIVSLLTQLDRYILRQLLVALLAITGALVALIWLTQSLHFVELVVNRGLSLRVFLELTALLVPGFAAVILPITTFVVVQFVYQRLAGDRELTVMRGAGLSPFALARPALLCALIAMAACYVLDIWVVPTTSRQFREYQFEIRNRVAAFLLQEGVFTPVSPQLTVYVRTRDPDGTLRGILVEDERTKNERATILAQSGHMVDSGNTPRVVLFHGSREEIDHKTGRLDILTFDADTVDLSSGKGADEQRFRDANEMSLHELFNPAASVPERDRGKMLVEGLRRLTSPLTAVSFAMVALVSVLAGSFRRHGNVLRPLAAVAAMVGLLAVGLAVASLATRTPAFAPLIWVHAVLPGLFCAWLLFLPAASERRARGGVARAQGQGA